MKTLKIALIAFAMLGVVRVFSAIPLPEQPRPSNERMDWAEIVLCDQKEQTIDIYEGLRVGQGQGPCALN